MYLEPVYDNFRSNWTTPGLKKLALAAILAASVGLAVGVIIGHFTVRLPDCQTGPCTSSDSGGRGWDSAEAMGKLVPDEDRTIADKILTRISANNIRENLR